MSILVHLLAVLLVLILSITPPAFAQSGFHPDDTYWGHGFSLPALNGHSIGGIASIALVGGRLYVVAQTGVGQGFYRLDPDGSQTAHRLAIWDEGGWKLEWPVSITGGVGVLIGAGSDIYVGGSFTNISGQPFNSIARWDGQQWNALGSGVNGAVHAMAFDGVNLYVGGDFTQAGGQAALRIARWNGSTWSPIIDVNTANGVNGTVYSILSVSGLIYVGGEFGDAGSALGVNRVAVWNPSVQQWSNLGAGFGDNRVHTLVTDGTSLYAGGTFFRSGVDTMNGVAKWNTLKWERMGQGTGSLQAMYASAQLGVYGFGGNLLQRWNGASWSAVGMGNAQLAGNDSVLYAAIDIIPGERTRFWTAAKWNGITWSGLGNGVGVFLESSTAKPIQALAYTNGKLYAGGFFSAAGVDSIMSLAAFDGVRWKRVGGDLTGGTVASLAVVGNDLYAGGDFTKIGDVSLNSFGKWNGTSWQPLGTGIRSQVGKGTVAGMGVEGNNLFVVGAFDSTGGKYTRGIAKWDGTAWSRPGGGRGTGTTILRTVVANGTDLYVGGLFTNIDSGKVAASNVAKWNGVYWSALGSGVSGGLNGVYALAMIWNDLYVAGDFMLAEGVSVNRIAKWDGSIWSPVGAGFNGLVRSLWANGADLYAAGDFKLSGTDTVKLVARWSGIKWESLGSGILSQYNAQTLHGTPEGLYVGGNFVQAGDRPSVNIALWKNYTPMAPVASLSAPALLSPANNATNQLATLTLSWTVVSGANSYRLQLSTDSTFATTVVHDSTLTVSSRQVTGLSGNTKYFWRVRSKNSQTTSVWSNVWNFRTGPATEVENLGNLPREFSLSPNFPNPFNPTTSLEFSIPQESQVKLVVYDLVGRIVRVLVDEKLQPSEYSVVFESSGLPSGIYFYRLEASGFVQTRKMVLLR